MARAIIAGHIEIISGQLDKLPLQRQVLVAGELIRRLTSKINLAATKLDEIATGKL